jgi:serine/threonine protein kinase
VTAPEPVFPALGGRYRLEQRIARGGMGEVWRATDEVLGRAVAVKVLRPEYADEEIFLERFRAEARNTAALVHTGIAQVYDFGQARAGGAYVPFIVMELVPGEPLSEIIERDGALELDRALDLVAQTARALQAAHDGGVIHRDVKPANLLVTPSWAVKVTDFGIARAGDALPLTRSGTVMGTAHYLAPEMVSTRGAASPSSDVYALGVVLYECLAGRRPFVGENPLSVAMAHLNEEPPPIHGLPESVRALLACVLSKDPVNRPENANELARRLVAVRVELAVAQADPEGTLALGDGPIVPHVAARRRSPGSHRRSLPPTAVSEVVADVLGETPVRGNLAAGILVPDPLTNAPGRSGAEPVDLAPSPGSSTAPARAAHRRPDARGPRRAPAVPAPGHGRRRRREPAPVLRRPGSVAAISTLAVGVIGGLWFLDSRPTIAPVPSVEGGPEYAATQTLQHSGFGIKVLREVNQTVPAGVVLMQNPKPGTRKSTDSSVTILVSSGPPKVQIDVADWRGQPYAAVRTALEGRGLRVTDRRVVGAGTPGTVTDVTPQGLVPVGESVVVTVVGATPAATAGAADQVQSMPAAGNEAVPQGVQQPARGTNGQGKGRDRQ